MNVIDLIFPKKCLGCDEAGKYICTSCINKVPPAKEICPMCGKNSWVGKTHSNCQTRMGLNGLISLWDYKGVVRKAIISLKYKYATEIAEELLPYMVKELEKKKYLFAKKTLLLPVPLYWYKQNIRGFNQSGIIGKAVSEYFSWRFIPDLLIRKKHTKAQVELKGIERKENIRGVFEFNSSYQSKIRDNYSLIIVDDVWTTGSTIKEAAAVLKSRGFGEIWGLTVAS